MKYKPNRNKFGEFSKSAYVRESKKDYKGQILAIFIVAVVVFLVGLGIREVGRFLVSEANRGWAGLVARQVALQDKAWEIAMQNIPYAEASEPLPYVPDVLDSEEDYKWYLSTLVSGREYKEIVKVIECETSGTWNTEIQSGWKYKHGKMKNKQELSFGLSQIHLPAHPDVTREEATDAKFALNFIAKNYKEHKEWWSCARILGFIK